MSGSLCASKDGGGIVINTKESGMLGFFKESLRKAGSAARTSFAVVGVFAVAALAVESRDAARFWDDEEKERKRVLVIPFHNLKLVKKRDRLAWLRSKGGGDPVVEMEVHRLVNLIHEAAADPSIVALYGKFGHGRGLAAGLAEVEEIRNALRVFRESHRSHPEANRTHEPAATQTRQRYPKPLYAYADTFESLEGSAMKGYYLASVFNYVHVQQLGSFNLWGPSTSVPFLKQALEKNFDGAKLRVHVFKHGLYKNAPNSWTEQSFTKHHKENVTSYLSSLNQCILEDIAGARKSLQFSSDVWKLIQESGAFSSDAAQKMGFVDFVTHVSPLNALIRSVKDKSDNSKSEENLKPWSSKTNLDAFGADEEISLLDYKRLVSQRKKQERRMWDIYSRIKAATQKYPAMKSALSSFGYSAPYFNIEKSRFSDAKARSLDEKIALIQIAGTIDDKTVRTILPHLNKIRSDNRTKCVVVRVDSPGGSAIASETLFQELKALPQNVIFSFGNVAASGGYYIAACADKIFASNSTITGSIGVFGVRFDLSEVASKYGVNFGHVSTTGELALTNNAFHPCTKKMQEIHQRSVDRLYLHFKDIVACGRGLSLEEVESVAGGRIWTGQQAIRNGLVDEIGGLSRAIAYARRTYTSGDAKVVLISDREPLGEILRKLVLGASLLEDSRLGVSRLLVSSANASDLFSRFLGSGSFQVFFTVDENAAIESFMESTADEKLLGPNF